jgi:tetratricopeptide (TPR) repeat protein
MRSPRQYLSERYPWLNLADSLAVAVVVVVAIVAIWPRSRMVSDLVLVTAIPGSIAAIVWGLTFWQKARVQIGRLKLRYKPVRRIAGIAALSCLPFLLLQQASIYLQGPNILRVPAVDVTGLSEPYPQPAKYSIRVVVAIAHLEGDDGHKIEGQLHDALASLDPRLHVIPVILNRTITLSGRPQGIAHLDALTSVTDVRVSTLIWGGVKGAPAPAVGPLYATQFGDNPQFGGSYLPGDFKLPELPLDILSQVISLMVATQSAELMGQSDIKFGDALQPQIEQVRAIADDSSKSSGWSADTRARVNLVLGRASEVSGTELQSEDSVHAAVTFFQRTQSDWTREKNPLEWAIAQRNLGYALSDLYDLNQQDAPLRAAITAYQNALSVYQSRSDALDSASMQFGLGKAFFYIGEHEAGSVSMRQAADYFRAATQGYEVRYYRLKWAAAQYNLGDALCEAADRDASAKEFAESIAAEREALKIYQKQASPISWAETQYQIAASLEGLGDMTDNREDLKQSIELCRQILDGFPRESNPDIWVCLQSTLGQGLVVSYRIDKKPESAAEAEIAFRAALEELSVRDQPMGWAIAKDGLGRALVGLGEARSDTGLVEQGVDSLNDALKVLTQQRDPVVWTWTKFDLADALVALSQRDGEVVRLKQAVDAYHEVLTVSSKDVMPDLYAKAQDNLKIALNDLHRRGSEPHP